MFDKTVLIDFNSVNMGAFTRCFTSIKQPKTTFQFATFACIVCELCDAHSGKPVLAKNGAFMYLKRQKTFSLEDLDEIITEIENTEAVEKKEMKGSSWPFDESGNMNCDLNEVFDNCGCSFVDFRLKNFQNSIFEKKEEKKQKFGNCSAFTPQKC